jgi:DNA polymerase-1
MIALDIETNSLNPRTGKIIGFSYSDGAKSRYICHLKWENGELVEVYSKKRCVALLHWLSKQKLILHNASFDLQFIKNYFGVDLLPALHCDTMLLAHFNDENKLSYGLKELGAELLGADAKEEQTILKEHLKSKGAGPKEFYKADLDIIAKYARKDVDLTMRLYNILTPELKNPDLFYNEIMEVYKEVVIPMQARGVQFDVSKAFDYLIAINSDIQQIKSDILREIAPHLDKFYAIYYDHNYPLKSRGLVADKMKLGMTLLEAQKAVAKDRGDEGFNIQSKHHLSQLFFDIMQLTPLSYTDKKAPQVDEDFLESIKGEYNFAANLILYNKLNKIKSTYYERFLDEHEDGIFYPQYYLHRTVSGRMSGDFQQLPRPLESGHPLLLKYNNVIREFFIARPGCILVDDDYDSLEPRIFASVAGDQVLIDIFKNGHDFYSTIAIMVEKLENVSADKKAENYLGKVNKDARQKSKAFSLGIAYGLDDYKLHKDLNIPQHEAKKLIEGYFSAFPKLHKWMIETKKSILQSGEISTRFGRTRHQKEVVTLYKKHGDAILNALDLWKKYNEHPIVYTQAKKDYKVVRHAINNAYNHQIQGLAGHILNRAAIAIAKQFKALQLDAYIIGAIHDELIIECIESQKEAVANIVRDCMENTTKIEVSLTATPSFGYSLKEAKG